MINNLPGVDAVEELWGRWDIPENVLPEVFADLMKFAKADPAVGVRVWLEKCDECKGIGTKESAFPPVPCPTCNGSGGSYRAVALEAVGLGIEQYLTEMPKEMADKYRKAAFGFRDRPKKEKP